MIDKVTRIVPWINTLIPDHRISVVIHGTIRIRLSAPAPLKLRPHGAIEILLLLFLNYHR